MSRDFETEGTERRYRCAHPSLRCSLCARYYDLLRPGECLVVAELRLEVARLNRLLAPPPAEVAPNPSPAQQETPTEG
jgi:hypothetical protein